MTSAEVTEVAETAAVGASEEVYEPSLSHGARDMREMLEWAGRNIWAIST